MSDPRPKIPIPIVARGAWLAALVALLAATGCAKRGPPPLEEVIVGEWFSISEFCPPEPISSVRKIEFRPDGTWMTTWPRREHGSWEEQRPRFNNGVYVLGPRTVFLREFGSSGMPSLDPNVPDMKRSLVESYEFDGKDLVRFDEDITSRWGKLTNGVTKKVRSTTGFPSFDSGFQARESARIAGQWISSPNGWILDFNTNMGWSTPNWKPFPWTCHGEYVVTRDGDVLMGRVAFVEGEYLIAEGDSLIHVDDKGVTNIFHRLPASAPPGK